MYISVLIRLFCTDNSKTSSLESNKKRISVAESERDSLEGSTGFVNVSL